MAQVLRAMTGPPEINDLVRVTLGAIDDPDGVRFASEIASRIEDCAYDKKSGKPLAYLIAAPWFSGDLEAPAAETECALQWVTPRGLCMLPCTFQAQEATANGLRVWRVRVTGDPRREERRRFVRVPWAVPARIAVRRDLDALPQVARQRAEEGGIRLKLAELPESLEAEAINLSEGGMRCLGPEPVLPAGLPLMITFTLENRCFETAAHVVWSLPRDDSTQDRAVETAIAFDEPSHHGEALRPLMFAAQIRARRNGLI